MEQLSFYEAEVSVCHERLDKAQDPLSKIDKHVDWSALEALLAPLEFKPTAKGGRPGWDAVLMVKVLILQSLYNIADGACEYQINDRLSFKRFLGLRPTAKAPDEKTIWLWRERIKHGGYSDKIFAWFEEEINKAGYIARKGQIIDATFVETHKPTGKHKKQLKEGVPLTPAQVAQIDEEATFTKKRSETHHGYKNHIQIDTKNKFIRRSEVTTAKTHDSQPFEKLVDESGNTGRDVHADAAYRSAESEQLLRDKKLNSKVQYRAYRNKPLSDAKKRTNTNRSKIRARVEHVFGHMTTAMGGLMIHTIGLARAEVKVTFKNLSYNIQRFASLQNIAMG